MSGRQSLYVLGLHGAIIFMTVIGAIILGMQGTLDASAVTAIFGAAVGAAGATVSSQGALSAAVNGKSVVAGGVMEQREQTLRQAIRSGTPTTDDETTPPLTDPVY